jgi:hypothetical protein
MPTGRVIAHLTSKWGGNLHDKGAVEIIASGVRNGASHNAADLGASLWCCPARERRADHMGSVCRNYWAFDEDIKRRVAIEGSNLAGKSLITWNAEPKQPVRQELQRLAVKRRDERIQSRIEHHGQRIMKTLED